MITVVLVFVHALGAAVLLAASRLSPGSQERTVRLVASVGIAAGAGTFFLRDVLVEWRGLVWDPDIAAVIGLAVACSWGLVISLDLESDRWWVAALTGVAASSLMVASAAAWTFVVVAALVCASGATAVAGARSRPAGWLTLALADAALIASLISDALTREAWDAGARVGSWMVVPVLLSAAVRAGLLPRMGTGAALRTPAAALTPLAVGFAAITVMRWVQGPLAPAAGTALVIAIAVAAWCLFRRVLDPSLLAAWPVGVAGGLLLVSERAAVPAACAAIVGMTVVTLWPDAIERGRLSRGVVLSCLIPTVGFGAIALAERDAFVRATTSTEAVDIVAWVAVAALLPVMLAAGVALGVYAARAEKSGGYHPEAVFMTWVMAAGSIVVGIALGTGAVYGALGGASAAVLFGISVGLGVLAGLRVADEPLADDHGSARVFLGSPPALGSWVRFACLALHGAALVGVGWFTYQGLEVGFL